MRFDQSAKDSGLLARLASVSLVATLTLLFVNAGVIGCQNEEIQRTPAGTNGNARDDDNDDDDGNDNNGNNYGNNNAVGVGTGTQPYVNGLVATGTQFATSTDTGLTIAEGGDDEPKEYPTLSFNGTGYTTYKMDDHLPMTQTINTRLDDLALTLDTTAAHVTCPDDLNGCDQGDVDEKVRNNNIGANTYDRASKAELDAAKASGFRYVAFSMFGKSVRAKNGMVFTFTSYLPIYPWPGTVARYADLDAGPITWTTQVTSSKAISLDPNLVDAVDRNPGTWLNNGRAVQTFNVTVTVTKALVDASTVRLVYDTTIAEDKDRMIYKYFPISKRAEYTIDMVGKNITQIVSTGWSNGDKSKEPEESQNTFKLCTKTAPSTGTQSFPCQ